MKNPKSIRKATAFFHPNELNILAAYLGRLSYLPKELIVPDALEIRDPDEWDESKQGICLLNSLFGDDDLALENAVARICLGTVQDHLPQWACYPEGGQLILGRNIIDGKNLPPRVLLPEVLFSINWADSGPGFSWPEAYNLTHIPFFDVSIVTGSFDSEDAVGYEDIAIGWFDGELGSNQSLKEIFIKYWTKSRDQEQDRWQEFLEDGVVSGFEAEAWADDVWPRETEEGEPVEEDQWDEEEEGEE